VVVKVHRRTEALSSLLSMFPVLLRDGWDDVEVGLSFGPVLVWYHWSNFGVNPSR
jgi:hypothetical protein